MVVYSFELNTYASMGEIRLTAPLTTDAQPPAATESAAPTPAATTPPPGTVEDRNG